MAAREFEARVIQTAAKMPPRKALRFLEAFEAKYTTGNTPAPVVAVAATDLEADDATGDAEPASPPSRGQSLVRRAMTARPKPVE